MTWWCLYIFQLCRTFFCLFKPFVSWTVLYSDWLKLVITHLSHVLLLIAINVEQWRGSQSRNHVGILWSTDHRGSPASPLSFFWYCWWFRNPAPVGLGDYMYINIPLFTGFHISQLVVWDFWTINCSPHENLFNLSMRPRRVSTVELLVQIRASGGCCQCTEGTKRDGRSDFWSYLQTKAQEWVVLPFFGRGMEKKIIQKWFQKMSVICWIGWDGLCSWAFFVFFVVVGWGGGLDVSRVSMDPWSPYCCHIFHGICIKPFGEIRNYAGVGDITMWYDVFLKIMLTSSKDC